MPIFGRKEITSFLLGLIPSFVSLNLYYSSRSVHQEATPNCYCHSDGMNPRLTLGHTEKAGSSWYTTFEPAGYDDGEFLPGVAMATNLFYNGSHFVLFQDTNNETTTTKVKVYDLMRKDDKFPFVILPPDQIPESYETLKNISWILLGNEVKYKGFLGHYFHHTEYLAATWAIFYINMKLLYPDDSDYHQWVEHVVIGPNATRSRWLKGNYTINEFVLKSVAPKATVYTEEFATNWIKFDRAFLSEMLQAGRGDSHVNKMGVRHTRWALEKDPLVFEQMKELVVNAATNTTRANRSTNMDNEKLGSKKLELLYINRQATGRSLTNNSHMALVEMLKKDMSHKINLTIVKMESYSPEEQIQISSKADIIIGVHGNGLTNALWMPKGGLVIEMFRPESCNFDYQWISTVSSQKYVAISGDLAIPLFTKFLKEPCRQFMKTAKLSGENDLNVTLVHQVLKRYVSSGSLGLMKCTHTLRD